jgi:hypothetical protein
MLFLLTLQEWRCLFDTLPKEWMESVQLVLDYFCERTPRSFVEVRDTSLVWNYKHADVEFGRLQARDLLQVRLSRAVCYVLCAVLCVTCYLLCVGYVLPMVWNYKHADVEFERLQARDLLQVRLRRATPCCVDTHEHSHAGCRSTSLHATASCAVQSPCIAVVQHATCWPFT